MSDTSLLGALANSDRAGLAYRWCQANANQSPIFADGKVLGDEKVAPFAKSSVAFLFKSNSGVYMPFEIEVIVH
jgi:hypothetical protein